MRRVIFILLVLATASPAIAADLDLDILRGSQPVGPATFTRWSGFYVGGQVGFGDANADFSSATQPLVHYSLRESTLENENSVSTWPVLGRGAATRSAMVGLSVIIPNGRTWSSASRAIIRTPPSA
jgi:outer membrane immunogenic protein